MRASFAATLIGLVMSVSWAWTALAEGSGSELRVLTYNTHGLPSWVVSDDPEMRLPIISGLLNGYDIALIQEDFAYPELLASRAEHRVIEHGNPAWGWKRLLPIFSGSGLTTLSRLPLADASAVTREPLHACSGWLGAGNDCLASKGFLRLRVRDAGGALLDLYNLHFDAGRSEADREARRVQLERLRVAMDRLSRDAAVIVGGDFNLDLSDPADAGLLEAFRKALRLRDSGARKPEGGPFDRQLDYLLYRDGGGTELELVEAGFATDFERNGVPLSDHPALFARFRILAR